MNLHREVYEKAISRSSPRWNFSCAASDKHLMKMYNKVVELLHTSNSFYEEHTYEDNVSRRKVHSVDWLMTKQVYEALRDIIPLQDRRAK